MDVVILAGGSGTRLREMTEFIPKPLIQVGGKPLIYHIMKIYAHYGFTDFILALGFKQEMFKEYFAHFNEINNDCVMHVGNYQGMTHQETKDNWRITLSDTGLNTLKGGRLKKVERYVNGDFFMTYGDAVADVDIKKLLEFHRRHGKLATVTGVPAPPRFGELKHRTGTVESFSEKPESDTLINGGFFVFNNRIFDYLTNNCDLEIGPLERIAAEGELKVYYHKGYWACCDTLRDLDALQEEWDTGKPKWRCW